MRLLFFLFLAGGLLLQSCGGNVSEEKVRKSSERSLELSQKYVQEQYEEYGEKLEDRIKALGKDIGKLKDVSATGQQEAGDNLSNSVMQLSQEKIELEGRLKLLEEKAAASQQMLRQHWNVYNRSVDSILNDMKGFLAPIRQVEEEK